MIRTEITIKLDATDLQLRDNIIAQKLAEVKLLKQKDTFPISAYKQPDQVGYTGEIAFAKWLHVPYIYKQYKRANDDVMGYQIKTTKLATGCLIKKAHSPKGVYVLGIANDTLDTVTFKGWMLSEEIQQECYWRTDVPLPAYFVPQSKLWSMSELTTNKELAAFHGWI
jgi:hypothetical protein